MGFIFSLYIYLLGIHHGSFCNLMGIICNNLIFFLPV